MTLFFFFLFWFDPWTLFLTALKLWHVILLVLPPSHKKKPHAAHYDAQQHQKYSPILHFVSSPGLFMMIRACQRSLMESASVKTCPFHCNKETKVNAFDHSDISERNEEEIERWRLGQIASKIEHDKPLIVISMWTLRESSVYDDGRIWMNMRLIWEERGKRKLTQRCIFQCMHIWRTNPEYQKTWVLFRSFGPPMLVVTITLYSNCKWIAEIWECSNTGRILMWQRKPHVGKVSPIFMEEKLGCKYDQTVHFVEQILIRVYRLTGSCACTHCEHFGVHSLFLQL